MKGSTNQARINQRSAARVLPMAPTLATIKQALDELTRHPPVQAAAALVSALADVRRAKLPSTQRIALLQRSKRISLDLITALRSMPRVARRETLGVQQALMAAMVESLIQGLHALDRMNYAELSDHREDRTWVLRNLARFFETQAQLSAMYGIPAHPGTWQDLYDTMLYLSARGSLDLAAEPDAEQQGFDLGHAIKRILLWGLAAEIGERDLKAPEVRALMSLWARATHVRTAEQQVSRVRVIIDSTLDRPPHHSAQVVAENFPGWIMSPPRKFLRYFGQTEWAEQSSNMVDVPSFPVEQQGPFEVDSCLGENVIEWPGRV